MIPYKKQHTDLTLEKWEAMPFLERLANIGSEVIRANNWREKKDEEYARLAFLRSLELIDLTREAKLAEAQLQELGRLRELWVDFFEYDNVYQSSKDFWDKYFNWITVASRVFQQDGVTR